MKRLLSFILVLLALSASGKTRDQVPVDACGAITQRTGTQTDTPFLYNGAYGVVTDPNGLLQMQARYYNPNIRRFINADPSGFSGGMNFYAFAGGDPVSLIDPSGLGASPIDGSEDYDPMMEGDRVKATLANLLSFGMAEEAAVTFTGHGLLDDTQVSMSERLMTGIGFAASIIPVERAAKLASGLAGKVAAKAESFSIQSSKTASEFAASRQGSGLYPGVDGFRDIVLKKGTIIYGGSPGQSAFYTTGSAIRRGGDSASSLFQGLQVARHKKGLLNGYRSHMTAYEVLEDSPSAFGRALANPQNGSGRLPQIVVPDFQKVLRPIYDAPLSP